MASHVVIIDSTARRATVKTTPGTFLSDVLQEGCSKLGCDSSQFGLKHNNKHVDLSRTIRLSGLSSGAKLELVQASKSAGVVSVALQLPESEARGTPNARLTDKFPSTTTLWLVLRKFEAGVAGDTNVKRNLTARGVPSAGAGDSGAGRLYYEQPVLNIMGRELASFTDLQKTLAQLGYNNGSALLRLVFRHSDRPLEEAMAQIQEYFDSTAPPTTGATTATTTTTSATNPTVGEESKTDALVTSSATETPKVVREWTEDKVMEDAPQTASSPGAEPSSSGAEISTAITDGTRPSSETAQASTSGGRAVSVFRPPSTSSPPASQTGHNETDFTPTVEHAQAHQKRLQQESLNKRLLTDAQLEAQAQEQAEKLAAIKDVEIKIRFPDQSAISSKFSQTDSAADLYSFIRDCVNPQYRSEAFILRVPGGNISSASNRGSPNTRTDVIPDDGKKRLIKDLQLKGRVLAVFGWDEIRASPQARAAKRDILKPELANQAQEHKAPVISEPAAQDSDRGLKVDISKPTAGDGDGEGGPKKKLPKWLKGLGKK